MKDSEYQNEKREQLEDAAVALLMQDYADLLTEDFSKDMEAAEALEFPEELDRRCRALIQQEHRKMRISKLAKGTKKVLSRVAMVFVALLALSSMLFMTVEAFRLPIMNFFIEKRLGFWELSGIDSSRSAKDMPAHFDVKDPLGELLPEGYHLVSLSGYNTSRLTAMYENEAKESVYFLIKSNIGNAQVDVEEAEISEQYEIYGQDGVLSVENAEVRLVWIVEEPNLLGTITAMGLSKEEVVALAEQITYLLGR